MKVILPILIHLFKSAQSNTQLSIQKIDSSPSNNINEWSNWSICQSYQSCNVGIIERSRIRSNRIPYVRSTKTKRLGNSSSSGSRRKGHRKKRSKRGNRERKQKKTFIQNCSYKQTEYKICKESQLQLCQNNLNYQRNEFCHDKIPGYVYHHGAFLNNFYQNSQTDNCQLYCNRIKETGKQIYDFGSLPDGSSCWSSDTGRFWVVV